MFKLTFRQVNFRRLAISPGATTFSKMTLGKVGLIVTFSIMDLVVSLSTSIECHHAECRFLFVVMLSVIILGVVAPLSLHRFSLIYQRMDSSTSLVFHGKTHLLGVGRLVDDQA
jgi:hypothetical protein